MGFYSIGNTNCIWNINLCTLNNMRKNRVYRGCEMESKLYWEIVMEMNEKKTGKIVNEYKTKRGKRASSLIQ